MSRGRKINDPSTRALVKTLVADGWVEVETKNHIKLRHPVLGTVIFARSTSDNARSHKNDIGQVRRLYREHDLPCPIERNHR